MKLTANVRNLRKHAKDLLGSEWTPEKQRELIRECTTGFVRDPHWRHVSHDRAEHLGRIGAILGTHGTDGMLLDRHGNDMSSECCTCGVALDIQYCNSGDTYSMTVMYVNGRLCIGDWGSLVERLG